MKTTTRSRTRRRLVGILSSVLCETLWTPTAVFSGAGASLEADPRHEPPEA